MVVSEGVWLLRWGCMVKVVVVSEGVCVCVYEDVEGDGFDRDTIVSGDVPQMHDTSPYTSPAQLLASICNTSVLAMD